MGIWQEPEVSWISVPDDIVSHAGEAALPLDDLLRRGVGTSGTVAARSQLVPVCAPLCQGERLEANA